MSDIHFSFFDLLIGIGLICGLPLLIVFLILTNQFNRKARKTGHRETNMELILTSLIAIFGLVICIYQFSNDNWLDDPFIGLIGIAAFSVGLVYSIKIIKRVN